ncbi:hypothetical protein BC936DRAFT_141107 [Jimgerdemannia flammicorona]|uniref:Uncharacterized protein n=1 Tax=Jimgerdemannia flammicorona TaxID=994334 RepID=A0A433A2W2_9FUNG|nr:hypothetical protein BC936DRAFT_141107 [Jimgerdemannia flammicorona]
MISNVASLHGMCGFTESDVRVLVQLFLYKDDKETDLIVDAMRKLDNGYYFVKYRPLDQDPPSLLYRPHLVFHYISELQRDEAVAQPTEFTAVHSTNILKAVSDIGEFPIDNLFNLALHGSIESKITDEFGFVDLLSIGKDKVLTCSLLLYLGILTRSQVDGNLRIPNEITKSVNTSNNNNNIDFFQVIERIASYLRADDSICQLIGPAHTDFMAGKITKFRELLETFLKTRPLRSLHTTNEPVLQVIIDAFLDKPSERMPELCLVVDGNKDYRSVRFGFTNIYSLSRWILHLGRELVLERRENGIGNSDTQSWKNWEGEDENALLAKKYVYWSKDHHQWISTTVDKVMERAMRQLETYMETIAKGEAKEYQDSGILNNRIIVKELIGYVIMLIGGKRILMHTTKSNEDHGKSNF